MDEHHRKHDKFVGVDLETFLAIVEGESSCLTLEQLANQIEKNSPLPADIDKHLKECAECAESYDAIVLLKNAASKAIETSIPFDATAINPIQKQ